MTRPLSDLIIEFVGGLRAAGVRISVAESLDAMRALGAAGLAPTRMREALRAALVKDEADSLIFDTLFASYFRAPSHDSDPNRQSQGMRIGVIGGAGGAAVPSLERPASKPAAHEGSQPRSTDQDVCEEPQAPAGAPPDRGSNRGDPGDTSVNGAEGTNREGADRGRCSGGGLRP